MACLFIKSLLKWSSLIQCFSFYVVFIIFYLLVFSSLLWFHVLRFSKLPILFVLLFSVVVVPPIFYTLF
jgi:hypothetical protein